MDSFCFLCFVFVILSHLDHLLRKDWSLGSLFMMFSYVFIIFPCGVLGQVNNLTVSMPDLCLLPYLDISLVSATDNQISSIFTN